MAKPTESDGHQFMDGEAVFGGNDEKFGFKWLLFGHLQKLLTYASQEMRGGFWQTKTIPVGNGMVKTDKFYVPDTREQYCNAVDALHDLLLPLSLDKDYKEFRKTIEEINEEIEQQRKRALERTSCSESEILSNKSYIGEDKNIIEEYRFINVRLHRKLFQILSRLLEEVDYGSGSGGIIDE